MRAPERAVFALRRPLALALALTVGCSATAPTTGDRTHTPAFGVSENPALQQIEVRKIADLPPLALVKRAGDVAPAVAATVRVAPDAAYGLARLLEARIEAKAPSLDVDVRVDRRAFALGARGESAVSLFASLREAIARPIQADELTRIERPTSAPAADDEADVAECEGRPVPPAIDLATLEGARAKLDVSAIAFGIVGPDELVEAGVRAWSESGPYPHGEPPSAAPWPEKRAVRVGVVDGRATGLTLALFVPDPLRAVSAAHALEGDVGDALRAKLERSPFGFRVSGVRGVSRSEGGCISVSLTSTTAPVDAAANEALASAAALVEASARDAAALPAAPDAALERVARAVDPLEAAGLAAWWTFAKDVGGEPVVAVRATLPKARADAAREALVALSAPQSLAPPEVDRVDRDEQGQGELWVALANPCAAAEEGAHLWGGQSLAARARAIDANGRHGVTIEPLLSVDGVGVVAHASIAAGESDEALGARVADAAAWALLGAPPSRDGLAGAELATITELESAWGTRSFGLDAFARAFGVDHPALVEPRGTVADVLRADYARARAAWVSLASGPLRLVTLANRGAAQGDAAAKAVARWLLPGQARSCAKVDAAAPDRAARDLDVDLDGRGIAHLGLRADAPFATVLEALVRASQKRVRTRRAGGILVLSIEAEADRLPAEVDALTGLLASIAKGEVGDAAIESARVSAGASLTHAASDPRGRLLELFARRASPTRFAVPEAASTADFKAWAKTHVAPEQWVTVRAR